LVANPIKVPNPGMVWASIESVLFLLEAIALMSLFAARISYQTKLPMADSLILATAKSMNTTLWTQDSDFKEIPNIKYIKK